MSTQKFQHKHYTQDTIQQKPEEQERFQFIKHLRTFLMILSTQQTYFH